MGVHDGNKQPQGFGHIGFIVDDLEAACAKMEADGVQFKKRPQDGNMRGIAFAYDPNGYWVELIDRKASFAGICANYRHACRLQGQREPLLIGSAALATGY